VARVVDAADRRKLDVEADSHKGIEGNRNRAVDAVDRRNLVGRKKVKQRNRVKDLVVAPDVADKARDEAVDRIAKVIRVVAPVVLSSALLNKDQ